MQRGYIGLILLLLGAAAIVFFAWGLPGMKSTDKSPMQIQQDALQKAKAVEDMSEARNRQIEDAMKDY